MLGVELNEAAGRTAYLAGYHAAQAFLFEREDRIFKTHNGIQGEFGRAIKDDSRVGPELRAFLSHSYQLKAIADYETGPGSEVTSAQATQALAAARRFVAKIEELIGG